MHTNIVPTNMISCMKFNFSQRKRCKYMMNNIVCYNSNSIYNKRGFSHDTEFVYASISPIEPYAERAIFSHQKPYANIIFNKNSTSNTLGKENIYLLLYEQLHYFLLSSGKL